MLIIHAGIAESETSDCDSVNKPISDSLRFLC